MNREGRLLGGSHRVRFYKARSRSSGYEAYKEWPSILDLSTGESIFLTPLADLDEQQAVGLLLADLGLKEESPPPKWVEKLVVPGAVDLSKDVEDLSRAIADIEAKKVQKLDDLKKREQWAKLVYATGAELEKIFGESLTLLGGKISEAKYATEEYVLTVPQGELLIEVKGNTKSVSLDNVRQVLDYTIHYLKDTKKEGKGVLFGNAWRLLLLDERDTKDKPYFPDDVRKTAEKHGIALISSKAYFEAFCDFLAGKKGRRNPNQDRYI